MKHSKYIKQANNGRQSDHPGPGGNWPSTTGNPSGSGRGNGTK